MATAAAPGSDCPCLAPWLDASSSNRQDLTRHPIAGRSDDSFLALQVEAWPVALRVRGWHHYVGGHLSSPTSGRTAAILAIAARNSALAFRLRVRPGPARGP